MQIDWFTFAAQIVNFLVLVALLRWLLYERVLRAMRQRERNIANRQREAAEQQSAAEEKARQYQAELEQLEQQRERMLKEAHREVHEERQRLAKEAREEVDRKREQWRALLQREQEDLADELRRRAGRMGIEAAGRILAQLADVKLEDHMYDTFTSRLHQLNDEQRREIQKQLGDGHAKVSLRSAFEVPRQRRDRLRDVLRETFDTDVDIGFEAAADLICGLQLDVGGYTFGWSVKDMLNDLDVKFSERLTAGEHGG